MPSGVFSLLNLKFDKRINRKDEVFRSGIKSNLMYNYDVHDIHQQILECVDDEQLEGSGFQFDFISTVTIEFYRIRDVMAYSWVEMPKKYKNSLSIMNIQNDDDFCFQCSILSRLYPVAQTELQTILSICTHTRWKV